MSFYEDTMNDLDDVEKLSPDEEGDGEQIDDYYYYSRRLHSKDFESKPIKGDRCTIDENIIQFHHSFGYDCRSKMFNICAADDHTIVYAAGNYIGMFDANDGVSSFRKCAGNGGIGHIVKNPFFGHLAIGENGCGDNGPLIIVYEWPTFEIVSVLRGSAKRRNEWLTYNRDGRLLCSQAGEPDNTLTIWDWEKSIIVLRTKSHTRDVYVCRFSAYTTDHLVTAGSGHIKFWKMANTFTGLKLKGRLGRFGKTEISDVIGIFSMPDEKVISGCDWGNILVWDECLVDVQVTRKGRNPCHLAPIIMFLYCERNAELTSVSMDGTIKLWRYNTADVADRADKNDGRVIELEPLFIIKFQDSIGTAKITGMCKVNNDDSSNDYFIQDGNGGMWFVDLDVSANAKPLRRLAKFHGDEITSLLTSPSGYFIATTSLDGWFHVYDVMNRKLMFMHNFNAPITSSIWLPLNLASSGNVFLIGFQTGILKIVAVPFKKIIKEKPLSDVVEIQSSKPHTDCIRHLTINTNAKLVLCGSDDCSIFVYKINTNPIKLNPIGMYPLPGKITFIHWKPSGKQTALISCASGHVVEVNVPTSRPLYTKESFLLKLDTRVIETANIDYRVYRHASDAEHENRTEKADGTKRSEIVRDKNPYTETVDNCLDDSSDDEKRPKVHANPIAVNPVLFAIYTPSERTLWVSVDGHGAGFLYEYDFDSPKPINATMIPGKNNMSPTTIKVFGTTDSLTVLMGFADGRIRVTNITTEDMHDLNDYIEYAIHDNRTGRVKTICSSHDNRMLFTCGDDGNIFSLMFQCDGHAIDECVNSISNLPRSSESVKENIIKTKEDLKVSLEEKKINRKKRKALDLANKEKDKIRCLVYGLKERFKRVLLDNESLPEPLRFDRDYFQFDERLNRSLVEEARSEMDKLHLKLSPDYKKSILGLKNVKNYFVDKIITDEFEVEAISKSTSVKTIYHEVHHNLFEIIFEDFLSKKHPQQRPRRSTILEKMVENPVHKITESEIFLRNIHEIYRTLPKKIQSAIDKFAARINFETREILKIKNMENEKPNNTFEESAAQKKAWKTIGDLNLKTAKDFKMSDDLIISMEDKFAQYISIRKEIHNLKYNFNEKVFNLKQRKIKFIHDKKQFNYDIDTIQNELNDSKLTLVDFPEGSIDELFIDEEPTSLKIKMQQLRRSHLKYRYDCLHESNLTKINMFDCRLLELDAERKDLKIRITYLDLFVLTLEEEMIILNDFDLLEDENLHIVREKTIIQNEKVDQIMTNQNDIANYNETIQNYLNKLIDIQHIFNMEVRNNNFSKHLKYIFKKKMKTPKVKTDNDDDNDDESLLSSSSDESEESEQESDKDMKKDSLTAMNRFTVLDENVMPEGCDPKLFALTFELRSQRHAIEQSLENIKKTVELSVKNLNLSYVELNVIEDDLEENLNKLEAYRIKKLLKLNEIEVTVLLKKSKICKSQLRESSVFLNENVMQVLVNRVTELKKETNDIKSEHESCKLFVKESRKEINMNNPVLDNYKKAIENEMLKKFKKKTDWNFLDTMEVAILKYMIVHAKFRSKETKEYFIKKTKLLENQIRVNQDILTDLDESNTKKTLTLNSIFNRYQQLQQDFFVRPKKYDRFQKKTTNKDDIFALKNTYDTLVKRQRDICAEIKALKYKGKMLPTIVTKQPQPTEIGRRDEQDNEETTCSVSQELEDDGSLCSTISGDEDDDEDCSYDNDEMKFNVKLKTTMLSKQSSFRQWSSSVDGSGKRGERNDDGRKDNKDVATKNFEKMDKKSKKTWNEVNFSEGGLLGNNDYGQLIEDSSKSLPSSE